jgi:hypothetical protein
MITKLVTSLSLNRQDRQHKCLASWRRFGLPIHAVATENQAEQLMQAFPEVDDWHITLEQPNAWDRPYLVRIADHVALASESPILLINSDIEIRDKYQSLVEQWMQDDSDTLVCGVRWEHKKGSLKRELNPYGIDAFRILPSMVGHLEDAGFPIGLPGWDYWLPWELHLRGFKVRTADSQFMHETHEMGYSKEAVQTAYRLLEERYRMPGKALSLSIQWLTGRMGMIRAAR